MKRREFVKSVLYTTAVAGTASTGMIPFRSAQASHVGVGLNRTLVNTMLLGGADLKFLLAPPPGTAYAQAYWQARKSIYQDYTDYESVWSDLYLPVSYNNQTFGIYKSAPWLKDQFDQGNVAIICNVAGSDNRRHDHSQLIMNTGDLEADQYLYDREGWGGRLAAQAGAQANVVAMSHDVSIFCNSVNPGNRLQQVVHVRDSRDFALAGPNSYALSQRSITARALKSYYEKRGQSVERSVARGNLPETWPFRRFFNHEQTLRAFGDLFDARLQEPGHYQPGTIKFLYDPVFGSRNLFQRSYGKEIANLYDCINAADILRLRVASIEFGGWDTHKQEQTALERNFSDLFSNTGGLASLTQVLENVQYANENLVYTFTSDFGRQLASNGDRGTDHGRGSYMFVISRSVRGGVYGEMFPQREITPDPNDTATPKRTPFEQPGSDIKGLTSMERVLAKVCDWVEPGSGVKVFPNTAKNDLSIYPDGPILEDGVDLGQLFAPGYMINGKTFGLSNGNQFSLPDVQVSARGATGATIESSSNTLGKFSLKGLVDGNYELVPSKPYFTFTPASVTVSIAGEDVAGIEMVATPQLHITMIAKNLYVDPATNITECIVRIGGYNFVRDQTRVILGNTEVRPYLIFLANIIFLRIPPELAHGLITLITPTEQYTHPVPLERI